MSMLESPANNVGLDLLDVVFGKSLLYSIKQKDNVVSIEPRGTPYFSGFGGLVISMLASGTQVRGFKLGRRPRRRWEDNIKIDVQEVGEGRGDWIELAQDRDRWRALVSTAKNLRVP
jgi:hypothetical protein